MIEPVFTYKIVQSAPGYHFRYESIVYLNGREVNREFCSTKWGGRLAARRYKKAWLKRGKRKVLREGKL